MAVYFISVHFIEFCIGGNVMPITSRAAVLVEPNKPLVVDEVTFPDPAPDQVLVKLFASGICHSQLH